MGFFITFEGCEGSGKTTQAKLLYNHLKKKGYRVIFTREPGGTKISNFIRDILLNEKNKDIDRITEVLLYEASRAQNISEKIKPALKKNYIVICDRFSDSTIAYQGYGRGINKEIIKKIDKFATGGLKPNLTILLDIHPDVGLNRIKRFDRLEKEKLLFHKKVRKGYLELAKKEPDRIKVFDATKDKESINRKIISLLKNYKI